MLKYLLFNQEKLFSLRDHNYLKDMFLGKPIIVEPIGVIQTEATESDLEHRQHLSKVIVSPMFIDALDGISEFSHLQIVFWLHKTPIKDRMILKVHPRHRIELPLVGAFAARTKLRPNPIGITTVELVRVDGNTLTVKGLDAYDGTPVLDIKPVDGCDLTLNLKIPEWCQKLKDDNLIQAISVAPE